MVGLPPVTTKAADTSFAKSLRVDPGLAEFRQKLAQAQSHFATQGVVAQATPAFSAAASAIVAQVIEMQPGAPPPLPTKPPPPPPLSTKPKPPPPLPLLTKPKPPPPLPSSASQVPAALADAAYHWQHANGDQRGPSSWAEYSAAFSSGETGLTNLVYAAGVTEWQPLEAVPELKLYLEAQE